MRKVSYSIRTINSLGKLLEKVTYVQKTLEQNKYFLSNIERPIANDELIFFLKEIGTIYNLNFPIIDVRCNDNKFLRGFTNSSVSPHTECCHESDIPTWICLYCIESSDHGGEFYLIDTSKVIKSMDSGQIEYFKHKKYEILSPRSKTLNRDTIIRKHPLFSNDILVYTTIGFKSEHRHGYSVKDDPSREKLQQLNEIIMSQKKAYSFHKWRKGDLLIFDNHYFMHGRKSFKDIKRHLKHIRLSVENLIK